MDPALSALLSEAGVEAYGPALQGAGVATVASLVALTDDALLSAPIGMRKMHVNKLRKVLPAPAAATLPAAAAAPSFETLQPPVSHFPPEPPAGSSYAPTYAPSSGNGSYHAVERSSSHTAESPLLAYGSAYGGQQGFSPPAPPAHVNGGQASPYGQHYGRPNGRPNGQPNGQSNGEPYGRPYVQPMGPPPTMRLSTGPPNGEQTYGDYGLHGDYVTPATAYLAQGNSPRTNPAQVHCQRQ